MPLREPLSVKDFEEDADRAPRCPFYKARPERAFAMAVATLGLALAGTLPAAAQTLTAPGLTLTNIIIDVPRYFE